MNFPPANIVKSESGNKVYFGYAERTTYICATAQILKFLKCIVVVKYDNFGGFSLFYSLFCVAI